MGIYFLMENKDTNAMGSNVKHGYRCKPEKADPDKPIMYYKVHLFVCDGDRCGSLYKEDYADHLREIVKEMNLHRGSDRIKVTRSQCFGACRFKGVATIYQNGLSKNNNTGSAVWVSKINTFTDDDWKKIFTGMKNDEPIDDLIPDSNKIKMKLYE